MKTQPLTEQEKFAIGNWLLIPGNMPLKKPERVDAELWKSLNATQRMRLGYHEWLHAQMLEGKL